jgi:hypothetical protein
MQCAGCGEQLLQQFSRIHLDFLQPGSVPLMVAPATCISRRTLADEAPLFEPGQIERAGSPDTSHDTLAAGEPVVPHTGRRSMG